MLNDDEKQRIVNAVYSRIQSLECPMCHHKAFTFIDGYVVQPIQNNKKKFLVANIPLIPTVVLVCNNCGFMSQHNLGVLGILNDTVEDTE